MNKRRATNGRTGWVVAALMIVGVSAGGVHADGHAGYTPPPTGTELIWARGKTEDKAVKELFRHRVIVADGEEVLYLVAGGNEPNEYVNLFRGLFSYAYWRDDGLWVEYKFDRATLRKLWPLAPGKEARVKISFGFGNGKTIKQAKANWKETEVAVIHYKVLRREKVTVPAGTFEAFVIERVRRFTKLKSGEKYVGRRIGWLVPKLGYVVKQTVHKYIGSPKEKKFVVRVISVKRPGGAR